MELFVKGDPIFKVSHCEVALKQIWEYEGNNVLVRATSNRILSENMFVKEMFSDREVHTLEEIYCEGCYHRPLKEVQEVAARTDRVLVSVLGTGVDFNHPTLLSNSSPKPKDIGPS